MNKKQPNILIEYPQNVIEGVMDNQFSHSEAINPMESLKLQKLAPYLYSINYDIIEYPSISTYMDGLKGACTAARKGKWYGRNLDWTYSQVATFIVRTSKLGTRHASVGIGVVDNGSLRLTEAVANSGIWSEGYKLLPGIVVDGINDCGVACNTNVVYLGDKGVTTGTNPGAEDLCMLEIPRFILDNATSAKDAVTILGGRNIFAPVKSHFDYHFMICDMTGTYIVEFPNNKVHIMSDIQGDGFDMIPNSTTPVMTNFYMTDWNGQIVTGFDVAGGIDPEDTTLSPHAIGLERYNLVKTGLGNVNSLTDMQNLMYSVFYTKAYDTTTNPYWYSEWVGGNLTVCNNKADFAETIAREAAAFAQTTRDKEDTWYTGHTSVFDLENKILYLTNNEDTTKTYTITL